LLVFGAATPEPDSLVQPFAVCVTVNVPALLTVIDEVVSVVLHNNVPEAVVDKVDVPSQLFTTFTEGVEGVVLIVKFNVTTLSHPAALVKVCVGVADEVYVTPYHSKLLQAVADVVFVACLLSLVSSCLWRSGRLIL
jgi:hypothetical protein